MDNFYLKLTLFSALIFTFYSTASADDIESVNHSDKDNTSVIFTTGESIPKNSEPETESDGGFTVFQYSIFSPIQLFPENYDVYGLRINALYGENRSMYGVDLGMYSALSKDMYGFQIAGVACSRDGEAFGVSVASIANMSIGDDAGLSVAGFMNLASGEFSGLQIAAVCRAQKFNGVQIGVFNHCDDFKGFQFGLVNICRNQSLPFTVFLNFRF